MGNLTTTGGLSRPAARRRGDGAGAGGQVAADPEWAEYVAWADREAAAGRVPEPDPWVLDDGEPWDPELDVPEPAPDSPPPGPVPGWPGRPVGTTPPLFAQDGVADVMPPVPVPGRADRAGRQRRGRPVR